MKVNKIYNENCLDTMARMQDGFIDLTITSPPYDNLRDYNGYSFDFESIAKELYRVTKDGGVVVWIVGDATIKGSETGTSFRQALYFKEVGFNLHDTMIYQKDSISFPESNRYSQIFEYMFVLSKQKPKTVNIIKDRRNLSFNGSKKIICSERLKDGSIKKIKGNILKKYGSRFNIWRVSVGHNKSTKDKIAFNHPAIFPEKLANDHIISWSNKGDLVYDCFMGSATTAKMAILNNRNYIGSEISKEYCDIAERRIQQIHPNLF
jgi:site-specific DNA-methyltransferase (adenine-specific)